MSGPFFSMPLTKTAQSGAAWASIDATFPRMQVFANCLLSAYSATTPERFSGFQPSWAQAYIVSPDTPMTHVGFGVRVPARLDSTVYLATDRLTFWLQVNNGGSANQATRASAVGIVYDMTPSPPSDMVLPVRRLDLSVQDEDGAVVGTHLSLQLEGGEELDEEEISARVLSQAHVVSGREQGSLRVAHAAAEEPGVDFRTLTSASPPGV
jgi:hypothetical protein